MPLSNAPLVEVAALQSNAAFYRAFSRGDIVAMSDLWARHTPVACLHPGAAVLQGREAVLASWRQILRGGMPFQMRCDNPTPLVVGETVLVTCYEANGDRPAHLAATNVFVLEDGVWRMVHHHAGPLSSPIAPPAAPSPLN
jgi:hypothetical protein